MSMCPQISWAAILVAALAVGCSSAPSDGPGVASGRAASSQEKGVKEATNALAAGVLLIKEYPPLPAPAQHGEYIRLLRERCGVDYQVPPLPQGVTEADFIQEVRGWNGVMQTEVRRKHGENIFEELREEAQKRWQERVNARSRAPNS